MYLGATEKTAVTLFSSTFQFENDWLIWWEFADKLKKEDKIEKVRVIFDKLKIKEFAEKEMTIFYNTALANLDSIDADTNKKLVFESFAKSLMQREN